LVSCCQHNLWLCNPYQCRSSVAVITKLSFLGPIRALLMHEFDCTYLIIGADKC